MKHKTDLNITDRKMAFSFFYPHSDFVLYFSNSNHIKLVHTGLELACRYSYLPRSLIQPVKSVLARNPGSSGQLVEHLGLKRSSLKQALCHTTLHSLHRGMHSFPSCSSVTKMGKRDS